MLNIVPEPVAKIKQKSAAKWAGAKDIYGMCFLKKGSNKSDMPEMGNMRISWDLRYTLLGWISEIANPLGSKASSLNSILAISEGANPKSGLCLLSSKFQT